MKHTILAFFSMAVLLTSCQNENQKRLADNRKETKKKAVLLATIEKKWDFYDSPINSTSEESVRTWPEFRMFLEVLSQKPGKTIGAFQKKASEMTKKVMALNDNQPSPFNTPQIKSRISSLITKVRMMDMYLQLDAIPASKVVQLIGEINLELVSLQRQMDLLVTKSKIPVEEGESDLIKMLDASRAIPTQSPSIPVDPNMPRVE